MCVCVVVFFLLYYICSWAKSSVLFDTADIHCVVGEPMKLKASMEETITAVRTEIQRLINTLPNTKQ